MRRTIVNFSLKVAVDSPLTAQSQELDDLTTRWRAIKGITEINVEWKSLPPNDSQAPLYACVDLAVEIEAETGMMLKKLYNKLTRDASQTPGRLAARQCSLTDIFE